MKNEKGFHTVRGYQLLSGEDQLTSSLEDYLEMIVRTCSVDGYIRINQLAEKLNVRPSSTTKVVQKLRDLGLVSYQKYGIIQMTDAGKIIGEFLLKRHGIIEEFLTNLGVTESLLQETEIIEHDVRMKTLEYIFMFNQFFSRNPELMQQYKAFKKDFAEEF